MIRRHLLVAVALMTTTANAQVDTNVLSLRGSRVEGSVALPSARLLEHGAWEISVGYAHDGEVVRAQQRTGDVRGGALTQPVRWVDQRNLAWVHLAVSPLQRFEFNASLPVLLGQTTQALTGYETPLTGAAALGDAAFGLRFALLERKSFDQQGLQWTLQGTVLAPTGNKSAAFSEVVTRVDASTTLTWQSGSAWAVTAHAGYQTGQQLQVADQLFGQRLGFGGAFAYRIAGFQLHADVLSNVALGEAAVQTEPGRASLELLGGVRWAHEYFFVDVGGGGAPIDDGVTPRWRVQAAFGARGLFEKPKPAPVDADPDRDGVEGAADQCPTRAEDFDGFQDTDGCPDPDNDGDGVPDVRDACPNEPEDKDGIADADGCPEADADADGVPDEKDQCPLAPEDFDGFEDGDGCPEAGSLDPTSTFRALSLAEQTVYFEVGSTKLDAAATASVREVAKVLLKRDGAVQLVGHADDQGAEARNDELSLQRAEAVKAVLVEAGVPAARLTTRGAGRREPVTKAQGFGHSLNRAVTFEWAK